MFTGEVTGRSVTKDHSNIRYFQIFSRYCFSNRKEQSKERFARENHSEIERRRRNKMNAYINELSDMVPSCNGLVRKPDKLTVLKMAVNYMKSLHGSSNKDEDLKPTFLSDEELKHLVLEATDGFLFVVLCKTGRLIYISDAITPVLNQLQNHWINRNLFDLVHPEDKDKLRDQLDVSISKDTRIIDLKTASIKAVGNNENCLKSGSRRSFLIRMRCGDVQNEKSENDIHEVNNCNDKRVIYQDKIYSVVHCTGYIRNIEDGILSDLSCNTEQKSKEDFLCLIAIGRLQPTSMPTSKDILDSSSPCEFITRQTLDGRFSFIDQRVTDVLGYRPIDLLGKLCFDFYLHEDAKYMSENYDQVIKLKGQPLSVRFHFKHLNGEPILVRSSCCSFQNPYTDEAEYIICNNTVIKDIQAPVNRTPENPLKYLSAKDPTNKFPNTSIIQEKPGFNIHSSHHGFQKDNNLCESQVLKMKRRFSGISEPSTIKCTVSQSVVPTCDEIINTTQKIRASGILANMARKLQQENNYSTPPSSGCSYLFHAQPQYNMTVNEIPSLVSPELKNEEINGLDNNYLSSHKIINARDANISNLHESSILLENDKLPRCELYKQLNENNTETNLLFWNNPGWT
ncbi:aryl hydrocarbon receptor nuclear translocator 2 isoform X2 [Hydra vulgaris]|uniref:aryl hydrocarbon receptor nuclear translocator 2 isoform X2 n=1 Tax=Hydra vulgaris TaxID=6087 RepID=UPI001F5EEE41|nr:aryl hydrocarbon receptor nuclear translocator 2 isoform X2 [Hydra vulgaris]